MEEPINEVSLAASAMGKKGGANGKGDAKRREPEHYLMLAKKRRGAIMRKLMAKQGGGE